MAEKSDIEWTEVTWNSTKGLRFLGQHGHLGAERAGTGTDALPGAPPAASVSKQ